MPWIPQRPAWTRSIMDKYNVVLYPRTYRDIDEIYAYIAIEKLAPENAKGQLFEFLFMLFKKIKVYFGIFQLRPVFRNSGMMIQIDDLCPRQCQQEGRMRADHQLIAAVPDRFRQEICEHQLVLRTQAVFRLVQQAQCIHFDLALEEHDCAFPVGPFP